jgi:hypothetical protein
VVKDLLRTRGVAHTGLVTDLNGTRKVPLKGLKYRLSIQASTYFCMISALCSHDGAQWAVCNAAAARANCLH